MKAAGFKIIGNDLHPVTPIMLGDARLAAQIADEMLKHGIYVIGFSYPVVPKGIHSPSFPLSFLSSPSLPRCLY